MQTRFLGLPMFAWAAICIAIALIWALFYPRPVNALSASGLRAFLLRWGHALCWLLLGLNFVLRGLDLASAANLLALGGLGVYLAFLFVIVSNR